jgi:hypothetical protein
LVRATVIRIHALKARAKAVFFGIDNIPSKVSVLRKILIGKAYRSK